MPTADFPGIGDRIRTSALATAYEMLRANAVMRSIAIKFTADEMAALAAYFGSLLPAHDATSSVVTNDAVQTK